MFIVKSVLDIVLSVVCMCAGIWFYLSIKTRQFYRIDFYNFVVDILLWPHTVIFLEKMKNTKVLLYSTIG